MDEPTQPPPDAAQVVAGRQGELERYLATSLAYVRRQGMPQAVAQRLLAEGYDGGD